MSPFIEAIEPRRLCAATLPAGFTETLISGTVSQPIATVQLPDGRLLVAQKNGQLRVFKNGGLLAAPALSLAVDTGGERGLIGLDIDPKFAANGYVYVQYFKPNKGFGQVSRFTMSGDTVVPGSELTLLQESKQTNGNQHCAGAIHFGRDGKLYILTGDNEDREESQELTNTHGKLLRINSNGAIPTDNPFYATETGPLRAIYAIGLRNPFTMGVDPVGGSIYIDDVGEKAFEEIDLARKGANYGWPNSEGPAVNAGEDAPVYSYPPPAVGAGACITGGAFYTGATQLFPTSYNGKYFFADFVHGWVQTFDPATGTASPFADNMGPVIDIDVAPDGSLLITTYDGVIHQINYTPPPPPTGTASYAGYVVNDVNANGKWDSGEKGIEGRTVWIDLDNDGLLDNAEPTAVTAANGRFQFTGLAAGTYKFREVVPTGWQQTGPANNFGLNATLTDGQVKSGASFQVTVTPPPPPPPV